MPQSPSDESAVGIVEALDALIADNTASLASDESAVAVVGALDALMASGAAARQRLADLNDAFANRMSLVGALRDALEAADGEAGGGFRGLIDALNTRIDRLDGLRDALRLAAETQGAVGERLRSLRNQLTDSNP